MFVFELHVTNSCERDMHPIECGLSALMTSAKMKNSIQEEHFHSMIFIYLFIYFIIMLFFIALLLCVFFLQFKILYNGTNQQTNKTYFFLSLFIAQFF